MSRYYRSRTPCRDDRPEALVDLVRLCGVGISTASEVECTWGRSMKLDVLAGVASLKLNVPGARPVSVSALLICLLACGSEPAAQPAQLVIPPKFALANPFSEGLALVMIVDASGKHFVYVDHTGTVVLSPSVDAATGFVNDRAAFILPDGSSIKVGYIDRSGSKVIPANFVAVVGKFSEGLARVCVGLDYKSCTVSYINRTGDVIIQTQRRNWGTYGSGDFHGGLAWFSVCDPNPNPLPHGCKYGYMDVNGKTVVEAKFVAVRDFSDGLAAVRLDDGPSGRWGYIDLAGKIAIDPQFASAGQFGEGLAAVQFGEIETGKWGYIDKTGATVISARFSPHKLEVGSLGAAAGQFSDKLAPVWIGDKTAGKFGYIDHNGRIVIQPQFDDASEFSEGLAAVRLGPQFTATWGYIKR
jgi:hypothetical protein